MAVKPDPGGYPQRKLAEVPAVPAAQMREIQRLAQEEYGIDILQITENAGRACSNLALQMLGGRARGQSVVVLAGGGNLGAAGLCAARTLSIFGFRVNPVLADVESEASFAVRRELTVLRNSGVLEAAGAETTEIALEDALGRADLVIDALVGYGLEGPPTGVTAAATELATVSRKPILALDVPTGVSAASGEPSTPAIRASTTLVLDLPKRGTLQPGARPYVGELYLADLGIPRAVHERLGISVGSLFSEGPIVRLRR